MLRLFLIVLITSSSLLATRINVGGSSFVDSVGETWAADNVCDGDEDLFTPITGDIADTADDTLFVTGDEAVSTFGCNISVTSGIYRVRLLFAAVEASDLNRTFSVLAEGRTVLGPLNVERRVGHATKFESSFDVTVTDTELNLLFTRISGNPFVQALEYSKVSLPGSGTALPTNCVEGQLFYKTTAPEGLRNCTDTDTWALVSATASLVEDLSTTVPANRLFFSDGNNPSSDQHLLWAISSDQFIVGDSAQQRTIIYGDNTDNRRFIGRYGVTGTPAAITGDTSIFEINTVLNDTGVATFWNNIESTYDQTGGASNSHAYGFQATYSGTGQGGGVIGTLGCDTGRDCIGFHVRVKDQDLTDTGTTAANLIGMFGEVDVENAPGSGEESIAALLGNRGSQTATAGIKFDRGAFTYGIDFMKGYSFDPTITTEIRVKNNGRIVWRDVGNTVDIVPLIVTPNDNTLLNAASGNSVLFSIGGVTQMQLASDGVFTALKRFEVDNNNPFRLYEPDANGTNYIEHVHGAVDRTQDIQISWANISDACTGANGGVLTLNGTVPNLTIDCEDDDGGAGGGGDAAEVEDGDDGGTFSAVDTTFRLEDQGDINFVFADGGAGGPDTVTALIRANSVALTTHTTGNYVQDVADGTGIDGTASGEGATYTPTLDLTEINSTTFGDNSVANLIHTLDPTGATNPAWTYSDGIANLSIGSLQEAGNNVVAAGDAAGGSLIGVYPNPTLGADAVDAMTELATGIKSRADDTDTKLVTTSAAAPAGNRCAEIDTNGSLVLASDACSNLGPNTAIDDLADAGAGDDTVALGEQGQTWNWDTATTAAAFDGLTLALTHDATTDTNTQRLLRLTRPDEATDAADDVEALLSIENLDAVDPVLSGIEFRSAAGGMTHAIDVNDADITNIITHVGGSVTSSDLDIIDDGNIDDTDLENEDFGDFSCTGSEDGCTLDSAAVTVEKLEDDAKTFHDCENLVDFSTAIPDTADIPSMWGEFPFAIQITKVWCEVEENTATINLQRDDGTPADILSADLVCDTTEQDSCASGCDVNTIQAAEDDVAIGEQIDFVIASIGANVNRINLCVTGLIQ